MKKNQQGENPNAKMGEKNKVKSAGKDKSGEKENNIGRKEYKGKGLLLRHSIYTKYPPKEKKPTTRK